MQLSNLLVALLDDSGDHPTVISRHLKAAIAIRNLICDNNPHEIEHVLRSTAVQRLLALLSRETHCDCFQAEFARIATHLATVSLGARALVQFGGVPALLLLLPSQCPAVRENALFAVSNIAGDSVRARDLILAYDGALKCVLDSMVDMSWNELRCGVEPLIKLCLGTPPPHWRRVRAAVPVLLALLERLTDKEMLLRVSESLINVTREGTEQQLHAILPALPRIKKLLTHESIDVVVPALMLVCIIVAGPNDVSVVALECGIVPAIVRMVQLRSDAREDVAPFVFETFRCIADGNNQHLSALVDRDVIAALGSLAALSDSIARGICDLLSDISMRCKSEQQKTLVRECDFVAVILSVLHANANRAMRCLHELLSPKTGFLFSWGWGPPPEHDDVRRCTAETLLQCGGAEQLEKLRQSAETDAITTSLIVDCLNEVRKLKPTRM